MSILDLNLNVPDPVVAPEGEAKLRLSDVELTESTSEKNRGKAMIRTTFANASRPEAVRIYNYILLPAQDDDEETKLSRQRQLKWLCQAVGAPLNFSTASELEAALKARVGRECWAVLAVESDPQYGDKNSIRKFVRPA